MPEIASLTRRIADNLQRSLPGRLRATGIHLSISLVIFAVAMYLILAKWYPGFHFAIDGGWQGTRIMVAVDLVLGPVLTLMIFNPFKARRLIVFDLACIGLVQCGALAWGFYAIHSQRPVAVSHVDGRFNVVTAVPLEMESYPESRLAELSDRTPALVHVRAAENDDEETRKAMQEIIGGVAEHEDPFFFTRFDGHWKDIATGAMDPEKLPTGDRKFAGDLDSFLAEHGGGAAQYRFFPYMGRYGTCTVVFSQSGELLDGLGCHAF